MVGVVVILEVDRYIQYNVLSFPRTVLYICADSTHPLPVAFLFPISFILLGVSDTAILSLSLFPYLPLGMGGRSSCGPPQLQVQTWPATAIPPSAAAFFHLAAQSLPSPC